MASPAEPVASHRTRRLVGVAKILLAVGILVWLLYGLQSEEAFGRLIDEPKHWPSLALALALVLGALVLNYARWYVLVRALDLDFTPSDAFRLGSLGLMLSQVSLGSLGGDVFKAVIIAREQPGKRTEAVASVLIDRIVGLYGMLLVASTGYLLNVGTANFGSLIRGVASAVLIGLVVGTIGIALLMTPWFTGPAVRRFGARAALVGPTLVRLIDAAAAYRHSRRYLFAGILMACTTHIIFATAFWFMARGLPVEAPPLGTMYAITPMAMAAGALPLTPSGLGVAEGAAGQLFQSAGYRNGDGVIVAITFRVMTYVMVAIGAVYYVRARRSIASALADAEQSSVEELPSARGATPSP